MRLNVARHIVQCLVLALFLSPVAFELFTGAIPGDFFFFGTLASSTIFGVLVLVDPFAALESIVASRQLPTISLLVGTATILVIYLLIRGRIFCGWICPVNLIVEVVEFLARPLKRIMYKESDGEVPFFTKINRRTKVVTTLGVLILSALCGIPVFELFSPVGAVFRGLILGAFVGTWVLIAVVIFEVFFPGRLWCRKLCPLGGFYQFIGRIGFFSVKSKGGCIDCDACKKVCIADPSILDPVIAETDLVVRSGDCMLCGKCLDACPKNILDIKA